MDDFYCKGTRAFFSKHATHLLGILFSSLLLVSCSSQQFKTTHHFSSHTFATNTSSRPTEIQNFIAYMVRQHQFSERDLEEIFQNVEWQPKVLELIARPFEAKPWYEYRKRFVNPERIEKGVRFWNEQASWLARAERTYGVAQEVLIGILGIETYYGQNMGEYNVLEALTTLAFRYPPRAQFFKSELESFLLYARKQGVSPQTIKGSYAGAMGQSQFIPSSILNYAVDFDGDGSVDLINSTADAIGSIAHYFSQHHWRSHEWIATPVQSMREEARALLQTTLTRPTYTIAELAKMGIEISPDIPQDSKGFVFALETENASHQYWVGSENLYVITRYNHSLHYAMAVYQLSEEMVAGNRLARR
ncbi:MAG: lytic murein transglycosylase B [Gammaproteobacteria bacterium]|nr:lytic murein transglycosylase B [Gammaproteobacteria bacterium]